MDLTNNPKIWGPPAWKFLYNVVNAYPDNPTADDKENYRRFFESLGPVLPCKKCRTNYSIHFETYPIDLTSKSGLMIWLKKIHAASKGNPVQMEEEFNIVPLIILILCAAIVFVVVRK